jgi:hypothetical protein
MRVGEGDVIKFGRVRFKIKKLVVDRSDIKEARVKEKNVSGVLTTFEGGGENGISMSGHFS